MRYLVIAILLTIAPSLVAANTQDSAPIAFVGKWAATVKNSNGATVVDHVVLNQNMTFDGRLTVNGKLAWKYSGTWSITRSLFVWHYEVSSRPMTESERVDTDEIVSVDDSKLVLLSKLSGKQFEYVRER